MSVRTGGKLDRGECVAYAKVTNPSISLGTWKCRILAEEPFNRTNVARYIINCGITMNTYIPFSAVCNDSKWIEIQNVFRTAAVNPNKFLSV